jgi:ABC-type transport system substrate-binding protein
MEMGKEKEKTIAILIIFVSFAFLPVALDTNIKAVNPPAFFKISILVPKYNAKSNYWATILSEQLPKIGIGVDEIKAADWSEIYQRVLDYQEPHPIPTFAEGGYDVLIYEDLNGLDFNPFFIYDSQFIESTNFLQYESQEMDLAIANYNNQTIVADRLQWANEIQSILYEDLPSLAVVNQHSLYVHDSQLTGWNPWLWEHVYQNMANWSIPIENTLSYAQAEPTSNFHIYIYDHTWEAQWLHQIYNGLIEHNASIDGFYGPCIASEWETTDGMNYTVQLRPDVRWADGSTLNASDVEYSFLLRGNVFTHYSDYFIYKTANVTVINEYNLKISFPYKEIFPENLLALPIVPKHIWENIAYENHSSQAETWALTNPDKIFGTGPYYLFDYNKNTNTIHLKRNDYYDDWSNTTPYFENIYFKYYADKESALIDLANGKLDIVDSAFDTDILEVLTNTSYTLVPSGKVQQIAINNQQPYIGSGELCPIASPESAKKIRKAISFAIPRQLIADEVYQGLATPASTTWPNSALDFDETLLPYDYKLCLAKNLMQFSGFQYCGFIDYCDPTPDPCSSPSVTINVGFSLISITVVIIIVKRKDK